MSVCHLHNEGGNENTKMNKNISQTYFEYIFIGGATVCVVRNISDHAIFLHSNCPHRYHHLFPSQNSRVQDVCVLPRRKSLIYIMFDNPTALLTSGSLGHSF